MKIFWGGVVKSGACVLTNRSACVKLLLGTLLEVDWTATPLIGAIYLVVTHLA